MFDSEDNVQMALPLNDGKMHVITPLIRSFEMGDIAGLPVYLKCDNCQPMGSFKVRGIGHMIQKCYKDGIRKIIVASGGNAGLAVAYSANQLGMDATVVCTETAGIEVCNAIQRLGATVIIHGLVYDESNKEALRIATEEGRTYISAFDHPVIWEGHASVIDEIKEQLEGIKPCCIVVAVGGGGYLAGVIEGLQKHDWNDVPIIALETIGTACFNESIKHGRHIVKEDIKSIAVCLQSKMVARRVFEAAVNKEHPIISATVTDQEALDACSKFLEHHRFMVEPACGAALASIYSGVISNLVADGQLAKNGPVVLLVCGGAGVSMEKLQNWKTELAMER